MDDNLTRNRYKNVKDVPVSKWVKQIAEGQAEYKTNQTSRKSMQQEFFKSKK